MREAEEEVAAEEGEPLFARLLLVARGASVSKDDYFSAEEGWDLMGLKSDLEIFLKQEDTAKQSDLSTTIDWAADGLVPAPLSMRRSDVGSEA